ncbi:MAG: FkbM family methyltransferase [Ardenticatenales bacterium]|nr:FkbM family methyltransferase [Ardenticatenales bacterium]
MSIRFKQNLKRSINKLLSPSGFAIVRKATSPHNMDDAFRAIAQRNHSFKTVIDVGASNGSWTDSLMRYFPHCQYLLIEGQSVHKKALKQLGGKYENVHVVMAAAGETRGEIYFDIGDPWGGQASYTPFKTNNIQVPVTTIDHEIKSRPLPGPYLIKLDTHGFEVPILKGASQILSQTDVIIMECYNYRVAPECLLFFEMCDYMKQFGFRCIDLVDPYNRPYDDSFWQMDLVFVRDNRPEFSYSRYR